MEEFKEQEFNDLFSDYVIENNGTIVVYENGVRLTITNLDSFYLWVSTHFPELKESLFLKN